MTWFPAGLMFGAAVASVAQRISPVSADRLLLIQPALELSAYFRTLAKGAHQARLASGEVRETSFAYPFPRKLVEAIDEAETSVRDALEAFDGEGTVLRHQRPRRDDLVPDDFTDVVVDGSWRFASQYNPELEAGVEQCLQA
jgi:hypothetical protein